MFQKLLALVFLLSVVVLSVSYGVIAKRLGWFPASLIEEAGVTGRSLLHAAQVEMGSRTQELTFRTSETTRLKLLKEEQVEPGLTLVTALGSEKQLSIEVVDLEGESVHQWNIDWFSLWPQNAVDHIPAMDLPRTRPGTHLHGTVLMENGDVVFNFETLGLIRLDLCGNVVWHLPYRTHHSAHLDHEQNIWVGGIDTHLTDDADWPNHDAPYREPTVVKVSPDGEILEKISIFDMLRKNDLNGLMYMSTIENFRARVTGDTLHLNDVEVFPPSMAEGVFSSGDIMVSLRNIHAVLVFSPDDLNVKFLSIGNYVRQHDPDFIDGDTISVFDNNNQVKQHSRILLQSARDASKDIYYQGSDAEPFFTEIMGKNQWLSNGNLLITESMRGRAFEIDRNGKIVWDFYNLIDEGIVGLIEQAERLPLQFNQEFFESGSKACGA